jgi:hypothetical protein
MGSHCQCHSVAQKLDPELVRDPLQWGGLAERFCSPPQKGGLGFPILAGALVLAVSIAMSVLERVRAGFSQYVALNCEQVLLIAQALVNLCLLDHVVIGPSFMPEIYDFALKQRQAAARFKFGTQRCYGSDQEAIARTKPATPSPAEPVRLVRLLRPSPSGGWAATSVRFLDVHCFPLRPRVLVSEGRVYFVEEAQKCRPFVARNWTWPLLVAANHTIHHFFWWGDRFLLARKGVDLHAAKKFHVVHAIEGRRHCIANGDQAVTTKDQDVVGSEISPNPIAFVRSDEVALVVMVCNMAVKMHTRMIGGDEPALHH